MRVALGSEFYGRLLAVITPVSLLGLEELARLQVFLKLIWGGAFWVLMLGRHKPTRLCVFATSSKSRGNLKKKKMLSGIYLE